MTGIREFLAKIKKKPSCMKKVDWSVETGKFGYLRIRSIIVGLEDDELCLMARNYIIETWCFITKREPDEIIARLKSCLKERKEIIQQELSKQDFEERTNSMEWKALYHDMPCDSHSYMLLKEENERLKLELAKFENNSLDIIDKARAEGIRTFVEQLIVNAEGEEKKIAREIRIALTTKLPNGYIGKDFLTLEFKQRLDALGRELSNKGAMNFNNPVGTVVAHADHVTLQYKENE